MTNEDRLLQKKWFMTAYVLLHLFSIAAVSMVLDEPHHFEVWVFDHVQSVYFQILVIVGVTAIGVIAAVIKKKSLYLFGLSEMLVGIGTASVVVKHIGSPNVVFNALMSLVACAYVICRGINDLQEGIRIREAATAIPAAEMIAAMRQYLIDSERERALRSVARRMISNLDRSTPEAYESTPTSSNTSPAIAGLSNRLA